MDELLKSVGTFDQGIILAILALPVLGWLYTLGHVIFSKSTNKLLWFTVVFFTFIIGAGLYWTFSVTPDAAQKPGRRRK